MARKGRSSSPPPPERPRWVVYGRNPVHEALRGPREVRAVWATENAAREPWLSGVRVRTATPDEVSARAGTEDHQGICADVSPYRYADGAALLSASDGLIVALDEV